MFRESSPIHPPHSVRPIRALLGCVLAIFLAYVALSLVRMTFTTEPGGLLDVPSLAPAAQHDDSWGAMLHAFDYITKPHEVPVYTKVFMGDQVKFQYPLTSLFVLYFVNDRTVLNTIGLILVLIGTIPIVALFNRFWTDAGNGPPLRNASTGERVVRIAVPVLMALTFYPIFVGYRLGQIQTWLATGFFFVVWLWSLRAFRAAGVLLGILSLVKPQFGVILLWGLLRRRWSFSIAFGITVAIGLSASFAIYGARDNLNYLSALSFLSRMGETFYMNQSVNGFMNRLMLNGDSRVFTNTFDRTFMLAVYLPTLISTILLLLGGLAVPARHRGGMADLMLIGFTCTIASPVAWIHHYSVVLPAIAALFVWSIASRPLGRLTLPLLCTSYVLLGTYIAGFWRVSHTPLNVVQSYSFAGALILLAFLYYWVIRGEPGVRVQPASESSDAGSDCVMPAHTAQQVN